MPCLGEATLRGRIAGGSMADSDIAFAALDRDGGERFQSLRRQLDVSSFGMSLIVLQSRRRGASMRMSVKRRSTWCSRVS